MAKAKLRCDLVFVDPNGSAKTEAIEIDPRLHSSDLHMRVLYRLSDPAYALTAFVAALDGHGGVTDKARFDAWVKAMTPTHVAQFRAELLREELQRLNRG